VCAAAGAASAAAAVTIAGKPLTERLGERLAGLNWIGSPEQGELRWKDPAGKPGGTVSPDSNPAYQVKVQNGERS
jgi:hypothetical protein